MKTPMQLALALLFSFAVTHAAVTDFTLVNADTNADLQALQEGDVINLANIGTSKLNIRADVDAVPNSVNFVLTGAQSHSQTEGVAPYALFGDNSGDYNSWTPVEGDYTLTADADGAGALTVHFSVIHDDTTSPDPTAGGFPHSADGTVSGELKKWHRVTIGFDGPSTSETATPNPFTDYRLDVTFTNGSSTYVVPGYYAADGNAANSGATSGNVWLVHFAPDKTGTWQWSASFTSGNNVAQNGGGSSAAYMDGKTGSFDIAATDKTGRDLRGKGRLQYVGKHHLQFAETGEYFFKQGPDAPENLLNYADFDGTPANSRLKTWSAHVDDWQTGDPTWKDGKGKALIGAINYLSSKGLNAFSFLSMNIGGDDNNCFPYVLADTTVGPIPNTDKDGYQNALKTVMDCSKLAQWEVLFQHATTKGMYLHFKTQETENDQYLDGGDLGDERKLYYRELIARFGHHLALNWNLGEENDIWSEKNDPDQTRVKSYAQFFYDNDPYRHNVVIHSYPGQYDEVYGPLLGSASKMTGASLQLSNSNFSDVFGRVKEWVDKSQAAGKPWVVAVDEPGDASHALRPAGDTGSSWEDARKHALWGALMAGGAGDEWYFGYQHAQSDLTCEDFRSRDGFWNYCRYAIEFLQNHNIPFHEMSNSSLSSNSASWCLDKDGEVYVVYLRNGGTTDLNLTGVSGSYSVKWYDPRNGGALQTGSVTSVNGGGSRNLGSAPNNATSDWVILVETQQRSIAYIHGDVSEDGTIPSGSDPAYDQMLLTDSGPTGLSEFKAMVEAEGYTITQHYDAETTLNAEFLNQFDVIVFGLHQKLWSAAEKTALDAWLQEGGGALFYSDSAAGGKWSIVGAQNTVGQSAVNNVISAYGMEVLVDQADGVKAYRSGPDATHPVVFDRPILEGEGVSPLAVDPASDVEILIPYVDDPDYKVSGNATTQHTQNITISNPQYAALATVGIGNGRLMAMFDRQPMWNDGPGSDIDMRDNRTILMRVVDYLAGNLVATGQHPYQNTPAAIPGTIVSGHYDEGGQGVAYYDTTTGFEGSDDWRSDDVDGGENVIAWFSNGEWLEYTVDVAENGTYTLVVNGASNAGGGTLHIEFGGVDKTGPIAIPDTGNWASFVEITIPDVSLAAGEQVMRVVKDSGSLNLGDMTFSGSASNTAPTANAGPSQTVTDSDGDGFADVSLDGSGSTDADGTIAEYVWSEGTTQIATGVNPVITLAVGTHTITLTVTDDSGASDTDTLDITVEAAPAGQAPYGGSVAAIPGTIVSGHYDEGGEGVAYHDTTAGFEGSVDWRNDDVDGSENVIGWFADGEWLEYTVNVAEAGTYDVVVKAACGYGNGGTLHIEFDGVDKTGAINVPYTSSWGSYVEMTVSGVSLEAGEQVMRVVKDSGYLNLSDMTFSQSSSNAAPTANAGPSQTVTDSDDDGFADVTLDGSGSTDSDGTIAEYVWSEGGVEIARTSSATITASLAVGTHALSLTVIDNDGAASTNAAEVTITVEAASGAQVVAAINCGGPAYAAEDGTAYSADSGFSGGKTYTTGHAISGTTDDSLYQSERYGNVTYSIPVDNGDYTVTLKMAEIYQSAAGQRVFDVLIEGALVVDDLDIYAQVGHDAAHDLTFTTTVSDGSLSIDMVSVINNAKMSAILVTQAVSGNTAPTADAGLDQTVTDVDGSGSESVTLDGGGSIDPDGTIAEYVWSESGVEIARTSSATVSVDLAVGTHALSLTVIDNEGAVSANAAEVTITVESPTETQIVAAINCGGSAYTAEDGTAYSADNGFSGGKTYTTGHAISGTTDDSLYQSERYGNVTYSIPVANGDYTVTLKMAEIYQTAAGQRLFDVLIEGAQVVDDLDIYAQVGHDAAHDLTFTTTVSDGSLSIDLVSVINNAKMSAILVTQQANSGSTEALVSADTAAFIQASSDDELASQPADAEFQVASGAFVVTKDGGSEGRHAELSEDVQGQLLLAAAYQREFTMAVTTTTAVWIFECTPGAIFEYEIGENSDVAVTYTMAEELTALLDTLFVEGEILDVSID